MDDHGRLYLVTGAGGAQGGAVARRLATAGRRVRGITRGELGLRRVPRGVEPHRADLTDGDAAKEAFRDVTHAWVQLPLIYEPPRTAGFVRAVADAALAAGVRRLVFGTGTRIPDAPTSIAAFETRRAAADLLLTSGVPTVVLRPTLYPENLCAPGVIGPLLREGVLRYPLPEAAPVAWLTHSDLAAASVAALDASAPEGSVLDIGGAEAPTGPELAAAFGAALGRTVEYHAQDPADFEAAMAAPLGADAAAGVAATYRWAATEPTLHAGDGGAALRSLGVEPTPLRAWIAARQWGTAPGRRCDCPGGNASDAAS